MSFKVTEKDDFYISTIKFDDEDEKDEMLELKVFETVIREETVYWRGEEQEPNIYVTATISPDYCQVFYDNFRNVAVNDNHFDTTFGQQYEEEYYRKYRKAHFFRGGL